MVKTGKENITFAYSPKREAVEYNPDNERFWDAVFGDAATHELGHRIDDIFRFTGGNEALSQAISIAQKTIQANRDEFLDYSWGKDKSGFISDIFSAIDGLNIYAAGHSSEYWKVPGHREAEIYANLFSLEAIGDKEKLQYLRKHFPEILKEYDKMRFEV